MRRSPRCVTLTPADAAGSGLSARPLRLTPRFVHLYLDQNGQCASDLHPRATERANRTRAWLPVVPTPPVSSRRSGDVRDDVSRPQRVEQVEERAGRVLEVEEAECAAFRHVGECLDRAA